MSITIQPVLSGTGSGPDGRAFTLRAAGLGLIVATTLVRLTLPSEPMPYWDADPSVLFSPATALEPAHSLTLDALTWAGAAIGLAGCAIAFTRWTIAAVLLAALGTAGGAWHGLVHQGGNLDDLRIGSSWAAGVVGALVTLQLARDERLRRMTLSLLIGAIGVLAVKGAAQILIEHPTTLSMYRETRDTFLQSQGWSNDSSAARAFERRLSQPEATGWFALSNVYASVAATAAVTLCGVALVSWKRSSGPVRAVLGIGSTLAFAAEAMSMSKGGAVATVIGMGVVAVVWTKGRMAAWIERRLTPKLGGCIGVLAIAGALLAVVARGVVGERLSELSLLFRWFYMQGAARIFAGSPIVGVGPAGFKDAYLVAKPPISPEEVTSPHSVVFDWAGTLGSAGLAWAGLWVGLVYLAGRGLFERFRDESESGTQGVGRGNDEPRDEDFRVEVRVIALMVMIPTLLGAWFDAPAGTIDSALVRVVGAVVWIAISGALCRVLQFGSARAIATAGAIALAAHGQIEVTPIWPGTACWVLLLFAALGARAAGSPAAARGPETRPGRSRLSAYVLAVVTLAIAAGLTWTGVRPAWAWQNKLVWAAEKVRPLAEFRQRFATLSTGAAGGVPGDSPSLLARDLSAALGRTIGDTEPSVRRAIAELNESGLNAVLEQLRAAAEDIPGHPATLRAVSKVAIQLAAARHEAPNEPGNEARARELADLAEEYGLRAAGVPHERSASWAWLGTLRTAREKMLDDRSAADRAIEAWLTATKFDPYGLSAAVQLAEAYQRRGDEAAAAVWARKALELDANTRLDPLKGLGADQRASLARLAGRS